MNLRATSFSLIVVWQLFATPCRAETATYELQRIGPDSLGSFTLQRVVTPTLPALGLRAIGVASAALFLAGIQRLRRRARQALV